MPVTKYAYDAYCQISVTKCQLPNAKFWNHNLKPDFSHKGSRFLPKNEKSSEGLISERVIWLLEWLRLASWLDTKQDKKLRWRDIKVESTRSMKQDIWVNISDPQRALIVESND